MSHRFAFLLLLGGLLVGGCSEAPEPLLLSGPTMGTSYSVKLAERSAAGRRQELDALIRQELERLEQLMSTYRADSELSRFNQGPPGAWFALSPATREVLQQAQVVSRLSGGAFDVTVGPLVRLWGFGPDRRPEQRPNAEAIARARIRVGYRRLELGEQGARRLGDIEVDLSAIAKGYAADRLASLLEQQGLHNFLVEVGGELRAAGLKANGQPWRIAVEAPVSETRTVQRVLRLQDTGIATSGDYRNYFEADGVRYSHTINPLTGEPIRHRLASVSVLHESAAMADALATALMVLGPEKGHAMAVEHDLAVFFIIRAGEGFVERVTPSFQLFLEPEGR